MLKSNQVIDIKKSVNAYRTNVLGGGYSLAFYLPYDLLQASASVWI